VGSANIHKVKSRFRKISVLGTYLFNFQSVLFVINSKIGMKDLREEKSEPLDVEAAILSREIAESLEKIFNVLVSLNLSGTEKERIKGISESVESMLKKVGISYKKLKK
jgi:hypothetical protein